eukprot:678442-Amphidinium_carterae.5
MTPHGSGYTMNPETLITQLVTIVLIHLCSNHPLCYGSSRKHINGETSSDIINISVVVKVPLRTLPWMGKTKYHLKQIEPATPTPIASISEPGGEGSVDIDYPTLPVCDHTLEHLRSVPKGTHNTGTALSALQALHCDYRDRDWRVVNDIDSWSKNLGPRWRD